MTSLPNTAATDPNNPGNTLASAVDAEIAQFRELQEQLHGLRGDLQVLMGQQTENEMVQTELNLALKDEAIYKRVGPVLVRQELDDAKETVAKRLEFIQKEQDKLKTKLQSLEQQLQEKGRKIGEMQANMQRMTAQAVAAIQQQHQAGNS